MTIQHTHTEKGGSFYVGDLSSPTAQLVYRMAGAQKQTTGLLPQPSQAKVADEKERKGSSDEVLPSSDVFAPEANLPTGSERKKIMIIDHTEVDEIHKGEGIGRQLVVAAVDYARQQGAKVQPLCSFARSILKHSKEYEDIYIPPNQA